MVPYAQVWSFVEKRVDMQYISGGGEAMPLAWGLLFSVIFRFDERIFTAWSKM